MALDVARTPKGFPTPSAALILPESDEYFVKYSVSEVRTILSRLKQDADAKQEELRIMVGERYRDVLEASTSIMSMAEASGRVVEALNEMDDTISTELNPRRLHQRRQSRAPDDRQLETLQCLAAHLKLLLDASEFLWRLLERKKFLHATWLFLLSNVVYRSVSRDDEDSTWIRYGVDVSKQFPLAQRHWDTISQFRPQIAQKATLFLRERITTPDDVCAAILALHLLDSVPLAETLDVFFQQRTRALQELKPKPKDDPSSSTVDNITTSFILFLETTTRTVCTVRDLFQATTEHPRSLVDKVLTFIHSEYPVPGLDSLPPVLKLSTQVLVDTLPSPTHLSLLPLEVLTYKPFIDLDTSSTAPMQSSLSTRVQDWFVGALDNIRKVTKIWFDELPTIGDVWSVRKSINTWLFDANGILDAELASLHLLLDEVSQHRVQNIWKAALDKMEKDFNKTLLELIKEVEKGNGQGETDARVVPYLLSAPPSPPVSFAGTDKPTLDNFKQLMKSRVDGYSPSTEKLFAVLSNGSEQLKFDMETVSGDTTLGSLLLDTFYTDVGSCVDGVLHALQSVTDTEESNSNKLIFLGHIAWTFVSSSFFLEMGCHDTSLSTFRDRARALYEKIVERWQALTVKRAAELIRESQHSEHGTRDNLKLSSQCLEGLLFMSGSVQQWGLIRHHEERGKIAKALLKQLMERLEDDETSDEESGEDTDDEDEEEGEEEEEEDDTDESEDGKGASDSEFIKHMLSEWDHNKLQPESSEHNEVHQQMLECNLLLAPLLRSSADHKEVALPVAKTSVVPSRDFQPAIALAKPSARFALLLVEGSTSG